MPPAPLRMALDGSIARARAGRGVASLVPTCVLVRSCNWVGFWFARIGLNRVGLDAIGLDVVGLDWIGLDLVGLGWRGFDCVGMA